MSTGGQQHRNRHRNRHGHGHGHGHGHSKEYTVTKHVRVRGLALLQPRVVTDLLDRDPLPGVDVEHAVEEVLETSEIGQWVGNRGGWYGIGLQAPISTRYARVLRRACHTAWCAGMGSGIGRNQARAKDPITGITQLTQSLPSLNSLHHFHHATHPRPFPPSLSPYHSTHLERRAEGLAAAVSGRHRCVRVALVHVGPEPGVQRRARAVRTGPLDLGHGAPVPGCRVQGREGV